eukprot:scaffold129874_cov43-Phaeocystis_antarctica.AAC.1
MKKIHRSRLKLIPTFIFTISGPVCVSQITKSRLAPGEGGHHLQFAAADRFSVRSKLRDTKAAGPPLGPTVELE